MTENKRVNVVSRSFLPVRALRSRFYGRVFFRNAYRLSFRGDLAFEQDMDMGIGVIIDSMKARPDLSRLPRIFLRDFRSCYTTVGERGAKFLEREALYPFPVAPVKAPNAYFFVGRCQWGYFKERYGD